MPRQATFVPAHSSSKQLLGDSRQLKLSQEQTNGEVYLVEGIMPEGSAVPLHVHQHEDEIFHVLEGEVTLQLGEETYHGKAGDIIYLPREIPHSIATKGKVTARVLNYVFPGHNFEAFFNEMQELGEEITPEERAALGEEFGITFL